MSKLINIMLKIRNNKRGFSLLEAIVSLTILVVVILAPLTLASQTVNYYRKALSYYKALSMAEEGIEMVIDVQKSNELYCYNTSSSPECGVGLDFNYFNNIFFMNAIPANCKSDIYGADSYCSFDDTDLIYTNNWLAIALPSNNACKYLTQDDYGANKCVSSSRAGTFARKINIKPMDYVRDVLGTEKMNSILVTSIVCFGTDVDTCGPDSGNKVKVQAVLTR